MLRTPMGLRAILRWVLRLEYLHCGILNDREKASKANIVHIITRNRIANILYRKKASTRQVLPIVTVYKLACKVVIG